MRLMVPHIVCGEITQALKAAGSNEIGGILMGEDLGANTFAVRQVTIQRHGGTFAYFVRALQDILQPLARFFRLTDNDYRRFNYLGEWHSHPSFAPEPSSQDDASMWEIVEDPEVGANFAVLLIVRLGDGGAMEGTAAVYVPGKRRMQVELVLEGEIT